MTCFVPRSCGWQHRVLRKPGRAGKFHGGHRIPISGPLWGKLGSIVTMGTKRGAQAIYMVDSKGLITTSRGDKLPSHKKQMARSDDTPNMKDLREIIEYVKPHALIGLSGAGPMFKQARPGHAKA